MLHAAKFYAVGRGGVKQDFKTYAAMYASCELSYPEAMHEYGLCFAYGDGVARNDKTQHVGFAKLPMRAMSRRKGSASSRSWKSCRDSMLEQFAAVTSEAIEALDQLGKALHDLGPPPWDSPSPEYQEAFRESIRESRYWYEYDRR